MPLSVSESCMQLKLTSELLAKKVTKYGDSRDREQLGTHLNATPFVQNKMNIVQFQRCNSLVRIHVLLQSVEISSDNFDNKKDTVFGVQIHMNYPKLRTSA